MAIVADARSSEHRQDCLCHFLEAILRPRWIFLCAAIFCATLSHAVHAAPGALSGGVFIQSGAAKNEPTKIVTDETGRRVTIPADVKRVVTLAPNLTETIYALGLEERLAGDTDYCDTPPAAKRKPHVGGAQNPSLEAIVALHPDLVLATTSINRIETVDGLAKVGITVYTTDPQTVRGMLESTARIAGLMGAEAKGSALVAKLQARLDALSARLADVPPVHALFVVWEDPLITIGQNTFIADAMRWAGLESVILSQQKWPHISFEEVVRLQPEYIVFASDHAGFGAEELGALRSREAWKQLRAVELGHIAVISEEINRPSPGLVDAIEQLAREVHPDAFRELENGKVKIENGRGQRQMTRANFGVQELQGLKPRDSEGSDMSRLKPRPTSLLTLQWAAEFGAPASMTSMRPDSTAEIVTGAHLRAAL
jgi:iron complex transport system substrate-binding protein